MKIPDFSNREVALNVGFLMTMGGIWLVLLVALTLALINRAPWQPWVISFLVYNALAAAIALFRIFTRYDGR